MRKLALLALAFASAYASAADISSWNGTFTGPRTTTSPFSPAEFDLYGSSFRPIDQGAGGVQLSARVRSNGSDGSWSLDKFGDLITLGLMADTSIPFAGFNPKSVPFLQQNDGAPILWLQNNSNGNAYFWNDKFYNGYDGTNNPSFVFGNGGAGGSSVLGPDGTYLDLKVVVTNTNQYTESVQQLDGSGNAVGALQTISGSLGLPLDHAYTPFLRIRAGGYDDTTGPDWSYTVTDATLTGVGTVPEPASLAAISLGIVGLLKRRRRA